MGNETSMLKGVLMHVLSVCMYVCMYACILHAYKFACI